VGYAETFLIAQRINLDLTYRVTADRTAITAVALYHELGSTHFSSVHGSCWSITIFLKSVLEVTSFRSPTRIGSSEHFAQCTPAVGWYGTKHCTMKALFYIFFCTRITTLHSFFIVSHKQKQTSPSAIFGDRGGHNTLFIVPSSNNATYTEHGLAETIITVSQVFRKGCHDVLHVGVNFWP